MGTITGQQIADEAWFTLQDTVGGGGIRWPVDRVLSYINAGQREIAMLVPSSSVASDIVTLAQNTRQTLAGMGKADGTQVIRIVRNFAADGTTPGRAISKTQAAFLDQSDPDWHSVTAASVVHFMTDADEPKACYVYPRPSTATVKAELVYAVAPADLADIADPISLDDIYANALQSYVLFRALSMRTGTTGLTRQEATGAYNMFLQALGIKAKMVAQVDAEQTAKQGVA